MHAVETLVVGAGQAGLAVSRCLTAQGADHVVVERGRIAERWRSARWDSLRLLTPNWMSRLPAWSYPGPDPDGYMAAPELVGYLEDYAGSFAAPVGLQRLRRRDVDHRREKLFSKLREAIGRGSCSRRSRGESRCGDYQQGRERADDAAGQI